MTEPHLPSDPLATIRNRGTFAIRRIETPEGPMDIVAGETGPLFPFESVAFPGMEGYEQDLAELRVLVEVVNRALSADAEIAALRVRVSDLQILALRGVVEGWTETQINEALFPRQAAENGSKEA